MIYEFMGNSQFNCNTKKSSPIWIKALIAREPDMR